MSKPEISTDIIELDVVAAQPVTVKHGMGRQVAGWQVIWRDAADIDFHIADASADTANEIVLIPAGSGSVRLVLL